MEVNTDPNWVLRDLIDEIFCTFDDDDFENLLFELAQPFLETPDVGESRAKDHLTRNYPVKGTEKCGWQDQNVSSESSCLDVVDHQGELRDGDDSVLEKELCMGFSEVSSSDIGLMFPTTPAAPQAWQDINGSFHYNVFRDSVMMNAAGTSDDSTFEGMVTELAKSFKPVGIGLHSGYLMVMEEGLKASWEKKFFVIKLNPNNTIRVECFDKMGGVLQGLIDCSCSEVVPSDEKHGITVVTTSSDTTETWLLKAFSAEQQYQWVQALNDAFEKHKDKHEMSVMEIIKDEGHDIVQL